MYQRKGRVESSDAEGKGEKREEERDLLQNSRTENKNNMEND